MKLRVSDNLAIFKGFFIGVVTNLLSTVAFLCPFTVRCIHPFISILIDINITDFGVGRFSGRRVAA